MLIPSQILFHDVSNHLIPKRTDRLLKPKDEEPSTRTLPIRAQRDNLQPARSHNQTEIAKGTVDLPTVAYFFTTLSIPSSPIFKVSIFGPYENRTK